MNEYKYHYLFTSFDIETFDVEDFKYNFVNITAFRLVDSSDIGVKELVKDMERYYHSQNVSLFDTNHYIKVSVERIALIAISFNQTRYINSVQPTFPSS